MFKILKCCICYVPKRCFANKKQNLEMKFLNVAEKNDAAKTIAGQLSNGTARRREGLSVYNKIYEFETTVLGKKTKMVMTSVSGHLLTFEFLSSYRNWNNVDPQSLFDAPVRKACSENFTPIKRTLEREVRGCQGLIIWTDCDREGENIGFEIIDVCRAIKPNITVYRAIFSEITSAAVRRALQNLTQPDKRQSEAVDVRSELDLRTGAAITRFQTMRLQRLFPEKIANKLISYGSCQIPTLGFVAERYKEIEAFVSEPFWKIKVTHTIDDLTVEFLWARNRLFDKQACEDYYLLVIANPMATVESVTVKPKNKWRPTPLDTVELEKLGSRKLKLPAKEVMTIAEKLYTKGIISYPRTETNMFSKDIDLRSLVEQQTAHGVWGAFAQRVVEWGPNPRNGNKSDQAHPPIHPTKMVSNLGGNEGRVYELICRHFLACVSKDATGSETIVTITIEGEKFTATGLVIFERNYLDVYIYDKWNAKQIHNYEQGQRFEPTEITMPEGHTTAPPLLTEADLIALMEKHGIGTDATHAEHINTIKERGYIGVVDKGCLVPGVIGMGLYEGYDAMELALAKPMLRAEFEQDLKKICLGEKDPKTVLSQQIAKYKDAYKQIMDKITAMDEKMANRILETPAQNNSSSNNNNSTNNTSGHVAENQNRLQELFKCPKCSTAPMALKPKKNQAGFLIGCLNYPDCKNCIWWPEDCKEPSVLDETCSKCGSDIKLLKFKFSISYHKTLFSAPSGWYKMCLRCDEKFRNTFNINLESVKRLGPIVGDISSIPINYGITQQPSSTSSSSASNNTRNRPKTTSKKTKDCGTKTETKTKKTRQTSVTATTSTSNQNKNSTNSSIRSYFTSAAPRTADEIASAELQDMPLDAFFDSNDGFDEIVSSVETNTQTNTATTTSNIPEAAVLNEDLAAVFNDDDDDMFADIQWGSENRNNAENRRSATSNNPTPPTRRHVFNDDDDDMFTEIQWGSENRNNAENRRSAASNNPTPPTRRHEELDESFGNWLQNDNDSNDDYVWGSAAKHARLSEIAPNAKRPKLQNSTTNNDADISWGSTSRANKTASSVSVKCTGCHQAAKELSVQKDGPNKGRFYFVCSKTKPCKFFQWSDEIPTPSQKQRTQITDDNIASTSNRATANIASTRSSLSARDAHITDRREFVNCNCNKPANNLTVRKEGPNKGRDFYACANRDKSCGFFKWADEMADSEINTSRSDNLAAGGSSWGSNRNDTTTTTSGWGLNDLDLPGGEENVNCNCNKSAKSLTVKKDGPNKGKGFYACANRDQSCGFFKWADETEDPSKSNKNMQSRVENVTASSSNWGSNSRSITNTPSTSNSRGFNNSDLPGEEEEVNCNCNKPAKSLTVRKDGPNKGKSFYACANRDQSCGFFQWANQSVTQDESQRSWGSSTSTETKTKKSASSSSGALTKGRKCGLCRQEGHTRQKCPRKGEFEY